MEYRLYAHYVENSSLVIGSFVNQDNIDALEKVLIINPNFSARIKILYENTLRSHPLNKKIVNILSHEDKLSILELKKNFIRLIFFIDYDGIKLIRNHIKAIVFLSSFVKKTQRTPKVEIEKAKKLRTQYFQAKALGNLLVEAIT